ncbi:MAG: hypothetical protein QM734_09885 [Cyclobacteriaceae bacterium]
MKHKTYNLVLHEFGKTQTSDKTHYRMDTESPQQHESSPKEDIKPIRKEKGIKSYFFEFLFMFLAVFMGFGAENFRESLSDRAKERDLMLSLFQNLKDDSQRLSENIEKNEMKQAALDSLLLLKTKNHADSKVKNSFAVFTSKGLCCSYIFRSNDATLGQLKYGGFILLPSKVADSIANYNVKLAEVYREETHYEHNTFTTTDMLFTLGDLTDYRNGPRGEISITIDAQRVTPFYNHVLNMFFSVRGYNRLLKEQKVEADKLIAFLKKEYKIEN